MITAEFGRRYSSQYDTIYGDKDYEGECDLVESAFAEFASSRVRSVLDLGCGTGSHAIALAGRGYDVTGVDRSEGMLEIARRKSAAAARNASAGALDFVLGDLRGYAGAERYDAVLMLFAVLGYQRTNQEVLFALETVRRNLKVGGLFLCDIWYGPAVLAIRPEEKKKEIETSTGKLVRISSSVLDSRRQTANVSIHTRESAPGGEVIDTTEIHEMRYFFPLELAFFMEQAGLDLLSLSAMPELHRAADENTWNAFAVGRAR